MWINKRFIWWELFKVMTFKSQQDLRYPKIPLKIQEQSIQREQIDMDSEEQDLTLGLWSLKQFTKKAIYHWSIAVESEETENI